MLLLQVLLSAASLLLVVAGVTKLRSPHPATRAARALSIPATPAAVRVLAGAEVALGIGALVVDAALVRISVGALYAAFLGFVLLALWRNAPISSCGCFGADDTPPSLGHVAINAAGAAVAFVAAADDAEAPIDALTNSVGDAAVLVAGTALVTLAAGALLSGWRMPRALRG